VTRLEDQLMFSNIMQNTSSANGNGQAAQVSGLNGFQAVQIDNSDAAGTATIAIQGSFDGVNWFAVGYQQVDNIAAPARSVSGIAVTAASHHVYQLLDYYPQVRCVQSAPAGFTGGGITCTHYGIPV
jgi:hypothetical protein